MKLRRAAWAFALLAGAAITASIAWPGDVRADELRDLVPESLAVLDDLAGDGTTLLVNGREIEMASAMSEDPADVVLARAEKTCLSRGGAPVRRANDVVCTLPGRAMTRVAARPASTKLTHVVTTAHEAMPDLRERAGARDHDAPGTDSSVAGRPSVARRILSASVKGTPYALRVYEVRGDPRAAVSEIGATLRARRFDAASETAGAGSFGATYFRGSEDVFVFASRDADRTLLSILEVTRP
jgi:hypothetical protein